MPDDREELPERLLGYRELRKLLGCSQSTAEMLVRTGQLHSVQVGAPGSRKPRRMFRPVDVEEYLAARATNAAAS